MGCNCGNKAAPKMKFIYTSADGKSQQTYTSEVQARAAQIRSGGTYKEVPA